MIIENHQLTVTDIRSAISHPSLATEYSTACEEHLPFPFTDSDDVLVCIDKVYPPIGRVLHLLGEHSLPSLRHSLRMTQILSEILPQHAPQLPSREIEIILLATALHDIGKIEISSRLLHKKGRLTTRQQKKLRSHPEAGIELLNGLSWNEMAISEEEKAIIYSSVFYHHRVHFQPYPAIEDNLVRDQLPFWIQLIGLTDIYEALTAPDRSYRKPLSKTEALQYLIRFIETVPGLNNDWVKKIHESFLPKDALH